MPVLRFILVWLISALVLMAETRVRIEGLQNMSSYQALSLLGDRLAHVRASPAQPSRADDAAFLLRQVLRRDGYADATVAWRIIGRDEIMLIVNEGGRRSLGNVRISGASGRDARRLSRLFARPAERGRPLGSGPPPFREEDVATGLANVRQEFNAAGQWSASVEIGERTMDPADGFVHFTIDVEPGVIYQIGTPVINSVDGRGVKLSAGAAAPFVGLPATTANLNAMRLAVEQIAVSRGYPDAIIQMGRSLEPGRFIPLFSIDLGTRVRLRDIRITGLERTEPERVYRRMTPMEGEWYDEAAMNKRLREMLATGAFSSARVETEVVGNRLVDATLHFGEARARDVSLGAGFGSYEGFIARVTYGDRNLMGKLWGLTSGFEFGSRGVLGDVRVTDPWVNGTDMAASLRVYALIYGREGYNTYEAGGEGKLTWEFGDNYMVELMAGSSIVNLTTDGLPSSELGDTTYAHPRIRVTQTLDFRDNPVLPTRGWHLQNPLEFGAAVGDLTTSYFKSGLSGGWFHRINRDYQIGIGGEFGMLIPGGDGTDLPIDLRLFNGGSRSVRSFPERELGPSFAGYPTGGEAMWNTNFELTRTIAGSLRGVAFFDAGVLSREYEDFGSAEIEMAAGLGLRLELPIGPVRFEYGFNLTRDTGEPNGTFHFAIGHAY